VTKDLTELKHSGDGEDTRRGYKLWCTESELSKGKTGCQQKAGRQEKDPFIGVSE